MRTFPLLRPFIAVVALLAGIATAAQSPDDSLHDAARNGDLSAIERAIALRPADLDREDPAGYTPLMLAAQEGHVAAVRSLLARGADARHANRSGTSVLVAAVHHPTAFSPRPPDAAAQQLYETVRRKSVAPTATADVPSAPARAPTIDSLVGTWPALPAEIARAKLEIVELLIAAGAEARVAGEATPILHVAVQPGKSELIAPLIRAGADVNARLRGLQSTALHLAVTLDNLPAASALLAHGADPELLTESLLADQSGRQISAGGHTPLMNAIILARPAMVRGLLDGGAKVETANRTFDRAIHFAARAGNPEIVALIVERGARVDVRDRWQAAPLNYAAANGHLAAAGVLVTHGAALEIADEAGFTPLLDAIEHGHVEIVRLLAAKGAAFSARTTAGQGPLGVAATAKNVELARLLIDEFGQKPGGESADPIKPLQAAVGVGALKTVALLIERGADVNIAGRLGNTPLHAAIFGRAAVTAAWRRDHGLPASTSVTYGIFNTGDEATFDDIIRLLAAKGAHLDATDSRGETPLHLAAKYGARSAAAVLLELGANRAARSSSGYTPVELASEAGDAEIVRLLGGSEELATRGPRISARARLNEKIQSQIGARPASPVPEPQRAVAQALLQSGIDKMLRDRNAAFADFEHAIEIDPNFAQAYNYRGLVRLANGDIAAATQDFDRAIALKPDEARFYLHRATARGNVREYDGALADLDRAIALDANYPENFLLRGKAWVGKQDRTKALADFDRALELDPKSTRALHARAVTRLEVGNRDGALADIDRVLAIEPKNAAALSCRGDCHRASREHAEAIADYTAALEIEPRNADASHGRALSRELTNDIRGALADHERTIELSPKFPDAYNGRGWCRSRLGRLEDAIADYNRAIELSPRFPAAHYNRGMAKRTIGDLSGALADFDRAIEQNPKYATAYEYRAITRQMLGDYAAAVADYDRHVAMVPANTYPHLYRFVCLPLAERGRARPQLATTIAQWKTTSGWTKTLGRYLTGEIDAAALLQFASENPGKTTSSRPCEAHFLIGMTELAAGHTASAREHFTQATATEMRGLTSFQLARAELARLDRSSTP